MCDKVNQYKNILVAQLCKCVYILELCTFCRESKIIPHNHMLPKHFQKVLVIFLHFRTMYLCRERKYKFYTVPHNHMFPKHFQKVLFLFDFILLQVDVNDHYHVISCLLLPHNIIHVKLTSCRTSAVVWHFNNVDKYNTNVSTFK